MHASGSDACACDRIEGTVANETDDPALPGEASDDCESAWYTRKIVKASVETSLHKLHLLSSSREAESSRNERKHKKAARFMCVA